MRIWVTGASGLLGIALIQLLQERNIPYLATTREQVDLCNWDSLLQFYRKSGPFTHLIHSAAFTQVDLAEKEREEAYRINAVSPALLGLLAEKFDFRMLFLSTDYVFDGVSSHPYRETDPVSPKNIYGKTKVQGERGLLMSCPRACIVRTSWLFGPGRPHFVSRMIDWMRSQEVVRVACDQKGKPTYTPDLALVLLKLLDSSGIYHVANRNEVSRFDVALAIRKVFPSLRCQSIEPALLSQFSAAAERPLYSVLDTQKVERELSIELNSWEKGVHTLCAALSES